MKLFLWIALVLATSLQSPVPDGVTVRGHVISPGSPALGRDGRVTMSLLAGAGARPLVSTVNPDGSFEFLKVGPGTYLLGATPGAFTQALMVVVTNKDISDLEVVNPKTVDVTANVVVENGGLLPTFTVTFSPYFGGPAPGALLPTNGVYKASLADGNYRMTWGTLPAGYSIRSIRSGSVDLLASPLTVAGTAVPPVTLTLGVSSPPPWVQVNGRVTGLSRTLNVTPRVVLIGSAFSNPEATISQDGTFTFPMVLPGSYTARITPTPTATPVNTSIIVGRKNVEGVEIAIPVTRCVQGRAVVEGDGPLPNLNFSLAAPAGALPSAASSATVFPRPDRSFGILLAEGERRIAFNPASLPPGYSVKSFTYGSVDLLRDPLRISSTDTASLLLTLAAAPGSWADVSGRVTGIDPTARKYQIQIPDQRDMQTDVQPDGTFKFLKVLRGGHTVSLSSFGGIPVSKPLIVTGQDIPAFELAAPPQKEVVGRITTEGGGQRFVGFGLVLRGSAGGSVAVDATAGADGNFKIALPEGESQVSITGMPAGAIKSLTYGTTDLLKEPLRVSRSDNAELRVILAAGTASGVVGGMPNFGPNSCGN